MSNLTPIRFHYRRDIRTPLLAAAVGALGLVTAALTVIGLMVLA